MQDQQFNVMGLVTAAGHTAERYAYTQYGQRQMLGTMGLPMGDILTADLNGDGDGEVGMSSSPISSYLRFG